MVVSINFCVKMLIHQRFIVENYDMRLRVYIVAIKHLSSLMPKFRTTANTLKQNII